MPVLYGVFLYMGVSSLKGIQVSALSYSQYRMVFFIKAAQSKTMMNQW